MKKIFLYLALPLFLFNLAAANLVPAALAQGTSNPTDIKNQQGFENGQGVINKTFGEEGNPADIRTIVANIIVAVLGLLAIIFLVLLISAGFRYMTSMGNEEQTSDAKAQIVSAIIGLAIILAAYAITSFVTGCLLGATSDYIFTADICGAH